MMIHKNREIYKMRRLMPVIMSLIFLKDFMYCGK